MEFLELRLRATTLVLTGYSTVCDRVYHVTACATSRSRCQNTPACEAVQYAQTNPMPAQMPGGKKPNARPNASNPVLSDDFFAFIAPRYNAAEVDRTSGNSRGPP